MRPTGVLIADDHAPTRSRVRRIIEEHGFAVVAEASDAAGAISAALEVEPDVCVLDIRMPGSGLGAAWEISARLPEARVVILTVSVSERDFFAALRAGAQGYVLKDADPGVLPAALDAVLRGETALPPQLAARLVEEFRDRGPRRRRLVEQVDTPRLTSREWEVLGLLREGRDTRGIADRLVISQATARSHIASLRRKLGASDRGALTSFG
jgi:DNA-binding NarL/FixJ family response regulator